MARCRRPARCPPRQRAADDLAHHRQRPALVLAERQDRAVRLVPHHARVGRRPARASSSRPSSIARPSSTATRVLPSATARGGVVEHDRVRRVRYRDAERVGRHARIGAAPGRDQRPRAHVDEMHRHHARRRALLAPLTDAAEVVRVGEPDDRAAVLARALDRDRHRLLADRLAEALAAVERDERAGVDDDAQLAVRHARARRARSRRTAGRARCRASRGRRGWPARGRARPAPASRVAQPSASNTRSPQRTSASAPTGTGGADASRRRNRAAGDRSFMPVRG